MISFKMKKLVSSSIAVAAIFAAASSAQAASPISNAFTVTSNLTSECEDTTVGAQTVDFGAYDAFAVAPVTQTTSAVFTMRCTRSFAAPQMALDDDGGATVRSDAAVSIGAGPLTGDGVMSNGLNYHLSVASAVTTTGTAADGSAGGVGSADGYTFTITGNVPADQAGTCAGLTCAGTQNRTLTITY